MKKLSLIIVLAILVVGGAMGAMTTPSYGQVYAPPPQNPYATPWVGQNTPWVYYNGDWFLKGILYYFFGPQYGWAPYYAYPPTYIVRPNNWYAPRWHAWYVQHPRYYQTFTQKYPYWRNHRYGQRYDQNFYNRYHRGQGAGWQKGFHGRAIERPHPEGRRPGPVQVTPREGQRPGPAQVTPRQGRRPDAAVTHPEGRKPGPAHAGGKKVPAGKPEKTGPGEEKH
jgi:hypothetical protein